MELLVKVEAKLVTGRECQFFCRMSVYEPGNFVSVSGTSRPVC